MPAGLSDASAADEAWPTRCPDINPPPRITLSTAGVKRTHIGDNPFCLAHFLLNTWLRHNKVAFFIRLIEELVCLLTTNHSSNY